MNDLFISPSFFLIILFRRVNAPIIKVMKVVKFDHRRKRVSLDREQAVGSRQQSDDFGPVTGGMRWRVRYRDLADYCQRNPAAATDDVDDSPPAVKPPAPEPVAARGPFITFTPPAEARVGEDYVVQAKAYDSHIVGFNWYFKKDCCPPGMVVDRYTGEIRWTPTDGGHYQATLCCSTLHGNRTEITWTICVRKAAQVRSVTPHPRFQCALRRKTALLPAPRLPYVVWRQVRRPLDAINRATAPPGVFRPVAYALRL